MKRAASGDTPPTKRTKASQACASCRRQKSRCEIIPVDVRAVAGAPVVIRCHRCKTLDIQCSFETSELIHFSPRAIVQSSPASSSSPPTSSNLNSNAGLTTLATVASSRPNVEEGPSSVPAAVNVPHITGSFGMRPEDLVPTASTPIWGSISRLDWTATPMLAIQELIRCPRTEAAARVLLGAEKLSDILSSAEITSLLEIFESRYAPWLCVQPTPLETSNSLLDIARCTIASRHLPPASRSAVAPRLQKLTEDVFLREIFNPQPSLESIQALLILSVWSPICGTGAETRDGRLLIASAVSMAMNLHLQDESRHAAVIRQDKLGLVSSTEKQTELINSIRRWRLWMQLSVSESMLCLGTGRLPVSQFSQADHEIINLSAMADFSLSAVRDIRLGLNAKLWDISETALKLRVSNFDDLEAFFEKINSSLHLLEGLSRLITPLPSITDYDKFYSQMLILQLHACRLLVNHHALRELRTTYERDRPQQRWYSAQIKGQSLTFFWGYPALTSAETVLSTFLGVTDSTLLSTAPDNIFAMVTFSAVWIFVSNFSLVQMGKSYLGGASERLQSMSMELLNKIALAPDHAAARCGHVLGALMTAWEQRKPKDGPWDGTIPSNMCMMPGVPLYPYPCTKFADTEGYLNPPSYQELVDSMASSTDLFMDDAFWSSFLENLNSDTLPSSGVPVP
ncbi:hypothetical protein R3P38DRAFT_2890671 [Favolaschia claudopus]|uniref:Zn(2)-C6 fungal-type domain-containing protein n=1 Tax=Favolaschia claudopus TaxID=2862362 RepID=A0AAW0CU55_9AGAR